MYIVEWIRKEISVSLYLVPLKHQSPTKKSINCITKHEGMYWSDVLKAEKIQRIGLHDMRRNILWCKTQTATRLLL